jgi:hypothetical protein
MQVVAVVVLGQAFHLLVLVVQVAVEQAVKAQAELTELPIQVAVAVVVTMEAVQDKAVVVLVDFVQL